MSFQPVIPFSGYTGWRFLQASLAKQQESFDKGAAQKRGTDYFRDNIGHITSAEDLVKDRQLLTVALTAFGLEADLNSRAFVQKILESPSADPKALANKLADKRYLAFSRTFGFGEPGPPATTQPGFAERILERYRDRAFEAAVGEQHGDMRLALNFDSALRDVLGNASSDKARWFAVMGNPPLRQIFQTALGLPDALTRLDIDRQLQTFTERSRSSFGTSDLAAFLDPARQEDLIRKFLIRSEAAATASSTAGSVALTLLRAIPRG